MPGPSPVRAGLSQLLCPVGQHGDNRVGWCVQNCKPGQSQYHGFCVQNCPTGMALNDQKTCIRPTFNRSFYISEKTIENTTVVGVGSQFGGGGPALTVGYFNKAERDFVFTDPTTLNNDATQVFQLTQTTGASVPFFVAEDFSADVPPNVGPAQVVGITNNFASNKEPTLDLLNGTVLFKSSAASNESIQVPSTIAKVETNPNNLTDSTRYQIRAGPASAQSNVIFNATASNQPSLQPTFGGSETSAQTLYFDEPAVNVTNNLELILSGALPTAQPGGGNNPADQSLQSSGQVVDQNSQAAIDKIGASNFDNVQALATRSFTLNNKIQFSDQNSPINAPILDPEFAGGTGAPIPLSAGQVTVGLNSDIFTTSDTIQNFAQCSALQPSTNDKDVTVELLAGPPHPINTHIEAKQNGLTAGNKSQDLGLQVNHVVGFRREGAFQSNGIAYVPDNSASNGLNATDIQNFVQMFARGFDSKSPYNNNLQSNPKEKDAVLSYIVEAGQQGHPILQTGSASVPDMTMISTSNLVPGMWSVTGNLPSLTKPPTVIAPTQPLDAIPLTDIDGQTGIVGIGDLYQNSTSDSMVISFCGASVSQPNSGGSSSDYQQSIIRFPQTGAPQTLKVPANCVNVHFILVGAGGSSEEGQGGSGAQVEGDLIANNQTGWWNVGQDSELSIIVGGGGGRDPNKKLTSFGGGGAGQATGLGQGGGRTSIQSVDTSGPIVLQKDRIVAGGGGGSTGQGRGGDAGAYAHGDIETSQASAGWPYLNGGQGAYLSLPKDASFHDVPSGSSGRGGVLQSNEYKSNSQSGGFSKGGSSYGFPPGSSSLGSGGGGAGYFGGGASAYLGDSDNPNDGPAGGGGGTSFAPSHSVKNLMSSAGSGSQGPSQSPLAMKLLANEKVGSGGSFGSPGNHGYAVIVLTTKKQGPANNVSGNADVASVYFSTQGFDPRVEFPFQGKNLTAAKIQAREPLTQAVNNAKRAKQLPFASGKPSSPIVSVFINNFFILACEQGPLAANKGFWFAPIGSDADQPGLSNQFSTADIVGTAHNIRAIRCLDGFNQPSLRGRTRIALIGDGIWILTIKIQSQGGTTTFTKDNFVQIEEATSSVTDQSLTDVFTFNDGAQNSSDAGEFLVAGVPKNITMSMSMHANLLPTFAVAVPAPDLLTWGGLAQQAAPQGTTNPAAIPQPGQPAIPGYNASNWIPISPSYLSEKGLQHGTVQDNSVKFATNGIQVVSIGGYLALDGSSYSTNPQGNLTIPNGSPQSFFLTAYQDGSSTQYQTGIVDWTTSTATANATLQTNNTQGGFAKSVTDFLNNLESGPLIRSPSSLLISEDAGSSFNLARSEQSITDKNISIEIPSANIDISSGSSGPDLVPQTPLTQQVALPLDQAHSSTTPNGSAQVQNFFNAQEQGSQGGLKAPNAYAWNTLIASQEVKPFTNYYADQSSIPQNMVSRFQDVCFFPDPAELQSSTKAQNQNDVVFFNSQRYIATSNVASGLAPNVSSLWKNTEGNVPGFFVAVGCFTWDLNMCHFLGGLPLAGTVNGQFTNSSASSNANGTSTQFVGTSSFGQKNTVPVNWFLNTSGTDNGITANANGLMNNCIWMLHTSDIEKSRTTENQGQAFKSRPLWSSRANENFLYCFSITNMEHQEDNGESPQNASSPQVLLTTNIGIYRISHDALKTAQTKDLQKVSQWNPGQSQNAKVSQWDPSNFVTAEPIASNIQCRASKCDACTTSKNDPKLQVTFAGTPYLDGEVVPVCASPQTNYLTQIVNGQPSSVVAAKDTQLDMQGQFNLLNVLGSNGGLLSYPNITYNPNASGSLGTVITNGATGPAPPASSQATQQLFGLKLDFGTNLIQTSSNFAIDTGSVGQSLQGMTLKDVNNDITFGTVSWVDATSDGDTIFQVQINGATSGTPPASVTSNQLVSFTQGSESNTSSQYDLQSAVATNVNSLLVGPNVAWLSNNATDQVAVLQGPFTGEDGFNGAQNPKPDFLFTFVTGPTGGRYPTGTLATDADGSQSSQASYRQQSPLQEPTGNGYNDMLTQAPFKWHPFLGLANNYDGQWDPQVQARQSLKLITAPLATGFQQPQEPGATPDGSFLYLGQVDAGASDLNGLQQANGLQSDNQAWFPTQAPKTYSNAMLPITDVNGTVNPNVASPITQPFQPSGTSTQQVAAQPLYGTPGSRFENGTVNNSELSIGQVQTFRVGLGDSSNATSFLSSFTGTYFSKLTSTESLYLNDALIWPVDDQGVPLQFSSLALDKSNRMYNFQGFLSLDLINFQTVPGTSGWNPSEAVSPSNQPNVSNSLGQLASTDQISNFQAQQVPLLFAVNTFDSQNSVVSVTLTPSTLQSMMVPMVATNFFRPRNWFFQWPSQQNSCTPSNFDVLQGGNSNIASQASAQVNDQPCEIIAQGQAAAGQVSQQQSEWLYPDPFTTKYGTSSVPNTTKYPFLEVLGLTQVQMPILNNGEVLPVLLKQGDRSGPDQNTQLLNPMVPLDLGSLSPLTLPAQQQSINNGVTLQSDLLALSKAGQPMANSTAPSVPMVLPDTSPVDSGNFLATWLAEDASWVSQGSSIAQATTPQSPFYCNTHGVYFSGGTVIPPTVTASKTSTQMHDSTDNAVMIQFQMDLFVNMSLLWAQATNPGPSNEVGFSFANVTPGSYNQWQQQAFARAFLNTLESTPNTPFNSLQAFQQGYIDSRPTTKNLPNGGAFFCNVVDEQTAGLLPTSSGNIFPLIWFLIETFRIPSGAASGASPGPYPGSQVPTQQNQGGVPTGGSFGFNIVQNNVPYFNQVLLSQAPMGSFFKNSTGGFIDYLQMNAPPAINGQSTLFAGAGFSSTQAVQPPSMGTFNPPVNVDMTDEGFQQITFTNPNGGATSKVPITTALQFIRMSYTITLPVSPSSSFQAPKSADASTPPGVSSPGPRFGSTQALSFPSPKPEVELSLVGYIGPPRNYKGSSNGTKTVPAYGVLIVNAGTGASRNKLVTLLKDSTQGSRIKIRQTGQFNSKCGPCTVVGTDPLFPEAKLQIQGGVQTRTQTSILDFTIGPGLGTFQFDTSSLYKDVKLTEPVKYLGSGVMDYVYIVVDLAQGDVTMPLPSSPKCDSGCVLSSNGQTYQFAGQKNKNNRTKAPGFTQGFGDGPSTPQFDSTVNMFQVDVPQTVVGQNFQSTNVTNGQLALGLKEAIANQQPDGYNQIANIDLSGTNPLPFFEVSITSGAGSVYEQGKVAPFFASMQCTIVPDAVANLPPASRPANSVWFIGVSNQQFANGWQSGSLNELGDGSFGQQVQLTLGATTEIVPVDPIIMTLNKQSGFGQFAVYGQGYDFFNANSPKNITNTDMFFSWGQPPGSSASAPNTIQNLSGNVRFQYSYISSAGTVPFPNIFEPTNLYQALWTPNLDILGSVSEAGVTQQAMNVNSWAIAGVNNGTFKADLSINSQTILPNKQLGVDIAQLLVNANSSLLQYPIISSPGFSNSSSLMRSPNNKNSPVTNGSLIYYNALQATVTYQDVLPAASANPLGTQGPLDVPVEFDPNVIYNANSQVILDGVVYENRGKPNALSWNLITGDNSNPSANVIVVQSVAGQTVAIGTEIVGRGIPTGTIITTFRQDPSTPTKKYKVALYLTLSNAVVGLTPGQAVFTTDPKTLANFDAQFSIKRTLGSTDTARASQEFYKSALAQNQTFTATLAQANPYIAQQTVPSSGGEGATRSGLGPPANVHPQSRNPTNQAPFPSTSFTHYYTNPFTLVNMNTFHVNPQFNAWTFAYLFNGLKGTEMVGVEGNLKVLPFSNQQTRGTGMIPISFIVAGLNFPGSTGSSENRVGFPNLQNSEIIQAPNLSKWTFDMTPWTHESAMADQWNQSVTAGQNTFVQPNLVRFSIPQMLDLIDAPTTNSRKSGLEQQPLPNNFVCVQAIFGNTSKPSPFSLQRGPNGLTQPQTTQVDLLPSHGTQNYTLEGSELASEQPGFTTPIVVDPLAPWGSSKNPILVLTNPMKDIQHNGFNGGFNPSGQGIQHDWPASLLYGDFHLGNGDPSTNQSNNGLVQGLNPAAVPPSSQRPQLGVAAVQKHEDKIQMKVDFQGKKGLWLNFPNWATQVPAAQSAFFDQSPNVQKNPSALPQCYQSTPLQQADPKQTLQGREIKTFDDSHFGSTRGDWQGGFVMTNRNQNDFNPTVFGSQEEPDQTRPPLFGWLMTQFSSSHQDEQHQYQNRQDIASGSLLPSNPTQQTPLSSFNITPPGVPLNNRTSPGPIHSNNASMGTYPEASGVKGAANENYLMSHQWPENIVTTSLTTSVPIDGTPQSPSFSKQQQGSFSQPTGTPGWNQNFPSTQSQSQRFDGGAVLNENPSMTPQSSNVGGPSCTTGISIWLDASLGDTICIHQNLLRPMTTVARPSQNGSPSLPGGVTMTSWPGVTDVGVGRIQDGGSSNPDGIQNFVPDFVPDVPLVNQPFAEINGGQPVEYEPHRSGQGAQGTNDGDDPQVICCYFSDAPDFGNTPKEEATLTLQNGLGDSAGVPTNAVVSMSKTLAANTITPSTQACVDIYQVFPNAPQAFEVFDATTENSAVTSLTNTFLEYLGQGSLVGQNNLSGSLVPLAMIPSTNNTTTGLVPQSIPDFSGLGLSLMSYDSNFTGPAALFTGTASVLLPDNQQWAEDGGVQSLMKAANAPIFAQASPFFKQANLFQPLNGWTQDSTTDSTNVNASVAPILFLNSSSNASGASNTLDLGNAQGLPHLQVSNPKQQPGFSLEGVWNASSGTQSGGLSAQPLRKFPISLTTTGTSGLSQLAPTCIGSNPTLTSLNRCVIGASNGTMRLFDFGSNQTISSTGLSNFQIITQQNGVIPVNVTNITQVVWFEKRWFVATNQGIFYTAIDRRIPALQGNTERNIQQFQASELVFVQFSIDATQTSNAALPPCTMLRKIRNKKKSYLVASFPDQAQGNFSGNVGVFPQLETEFGAIAMGLPLNSGNSLPQNGAQQNSSFGNASPGVVCQSLQLITKVSSKLSLNQFKVVSKFTGLPTVGFNASGGGSTSAPWQTQNTLPFLAVSTTNASTTFTSFLPQMNSQITDISLVGDRVLQSSMQVPQKMTSATGDNMQAQVQSMSQGSKSALLSFKNDILAPTPQKNAFAKGSAGDGSTIYDVNATPASTQGDTTMRIAQCITVSNSLPNTLQPTTTTNPNITTFLNTFFNGLQSSLQKSGQAYEPSQNQATLDPHAYDSGLGILSVQFQKQVLPLEGVLLQARPNVAGFGLEAGSLGVFVASAPWTVQNGSQSFATSQVTSIETDIFMEAFWGFNNKTLLVFGQQAPSNGGATMNQALVVPNSSTQFQAVALGNQGPSNANAQGFTFFGNQMTSYFNSALMQWSTTAVQKPTFSPKSWKPDSALNQAFADNPTEDNAPPLNELLFESIQVSRLNVVWSNDSIGDFTQAPDLKGGIMAWTVSGPQSTLPIQMSGAQTDVPGINFKGVVVPETIQNTDASPTSSVTGVSYVQPGFGLPAIATNAILAQNPQTNEFWGAGIGLGVDDQFQMDSQTSFNPETQTDAKFKPQKRRQQRFMIVRNPGARGTDFQAQPNGGGVPSEATDLLPSTLNWVEEVNILPTRVASGNTQKVPITLLSQSFAQGGNAFVSAIEFSPNATVIAGYVVFPSASKGIQTALWYRNIDQVSWAQGNLQVPGRITAVKFVNFGWYIAVTYNVNETKQASSLYFASANFSVITLVDTWGPMQTNIEINSFAQTIRPNVQPCDAAAGFEPNPVNPRTCLKKCPPGQDPVGDLCALSCPPERGFKTTLVPNECLPLKQKPSKVPGVGPNTGSHAANNEEKPIPDLVEPPAPIETIRGAILGIVLTVLIIAFIAQIVYMFRFQKITKPNF